MSPSINNWRDRPTEHSHYAEIVTDITTPNSEQKDNTKIKTINRSNTNPTKKPGVNSGAREDIIGIYLFLL